MPQLVDKRTFEKGMNCDIDNNLLPQGQYKYALNFRNSPSGSIGVLESVKGNELVTFDYMPTGGNKVIGAESFDNNSSVYYFVWNSEGNHTILEYDSIKNVISTVFRGGVLDFKNNVFITSINIVRFKDNTIIYWADPNGEPKKVSIESGIRTFDDLRGVYEGIWSAGTYNSGDVVSVDFGDLFFGKTFYYKATTTTSNQPYLDLGVVTEYDANPLPNSGWELAEVGYVYPNTLTLDVITQLSKPPITPPVVNYVSNSNLPTNRLKGSFWQMKYKYVYFDGQESAWSPISKTPVPSEFANPFDIQSVDVYKDNQIDIYVDVLDNKLVSSIKIAVRSVSDNLSKNDFYQFDEIFSNNISNEWVDGGIISSFTNTEESIPINTYDSNQLFYWIPRKSVSQQLSGDNRLIHANGTWGYDLSDNIISENPPIIRSTYGDANTIPNDDLAIGGTALPTSNPIVSNGITKAGTGSFIDISTVTSPISAGDVFILNMTGNTQVYRNGAPWDKGFDFTDGKLKHDFLYKYTVSPVDAASLSGAALYEKIANDISAKMKSKSWDFKYENTFGNLKTQSHDRPYLWMTNDGSGSVLRAYVSIGYKHAQLGDVYVTVTTVDNLLIQHIKSGSQNDRTYKRGSIQRFGLVYSDDLGRVSTVVSNPSLSHYINWYSGTSSTGNGLVSLDLDIYNEAPSWASKCHIVKKVENGISSFIQLPMSKGVVEEGITATTLNGETKGYYFVSGFIDESGQTVDPSFGGNVFVNIYLNSLNSGSIYSYNNMIGESILSYSFTKGDRLRFVQNKLGSIYYEDDVEILGYNDTLNYITINYNQLNPTGYLHTLLHDSNMTNVTAEGALFEIYTPQKEVDATGFYYETGITLDVVDGVHYGTDGVAQSLASGSPAKVALDCGDVYRKTRWYNVDINGATKNGVQYVVEEYNYSDTFESKAYNVGRYNVKTQTDIESEVVSGSAFSSDKFSTIFYSEPYIQGTNVNRLGTVYDTSFKEADASFNSIQYIHSDGDKLFIFQEDRVGLAHNSRYVSTDLESDTSVSSGLTAPVISDIQYYSYRGGISLNPESFAFFENSKFWFDSRRGTINRLAQNGIDAISLKGIDKYVNGVSNDMLSGTEKDFAIGVYDKANMEYVLNFKWSESVSVTPVYIGLSGLSEYLYDIDMGEGIYMSQFYVGDNLSLFDTVTNSYPKNTIVSVTGQVIRVRSLSSFEPEARFEVNAYRSDVVSYSDRIGAWSSFYSYKPDFMSISGLKLITWSNSNLYVHDSDSVNPMNFYGVGYDGELEVVSNKDPLNNKSYLAIKVQDSSEYVLVDDKPVIDWETVTDGITTETDQVSDLLSDDFEFREGNVYSSFLRDKNTPNLSVPLLDGEILKGSWIAVKLKLKSGITKLKKVIGAEIRSAISFRAQ